MKPIKTATFNSVKYKIDLDAQCSCSCDPPHKPPDREICIYEPIKNDQNTLYLMIHEAMHALFWHLPEEDVIIRSKDMARFLWRAGWRLK